MEYADVAVGMRDWARYEVGFKAFRKAVDGVAACEETARKGFVDGAYAKLGGVEEVVVRKQVAEEMGRMMFDQNAGVVMGDAAKMIGKVIAEECLVDDAGAELNCIVIKRLCDASADPFLHSLSRWATIDKSMTTFPTFTVPYLFSLPLCPPLPTTELTSSPPLTTSLLRQTLPTLAILAWRTQKLTIALLRGRVSVKNVATTILQDLRRATMEVGTRAVASVMIRTAGLSYRWESPLTLILTAGVSYALHTTKVLPFLMKDSHAAWCAASLLQTKEEAAFWPWQSSTATLPQMPCVVDIVEKTPMPAMRPPMGMAPPGHAPGHTPHVPDLD